MRAGVQPLAHEQGVHPLPRLCKPGVRLGVQWLPESPRPLLLQLRPGGVRLRVPLSDDAAGRARPRPQRRCCHGSRVRALDPRLRLCRPWPPGRRGQPPCGSRWRRCRPRARQGHGHGVVPGGAAVAAPPCCAAGAWVPASQGVNRCGGHQVVHPTTLYSTSGRHEGGCPLCCGSARVSRRRCRLYRADRARHLSSEHERLVVAEGGCRAVGRHVATGDLDQRRQGPVAGWAGRGATAAAAAPGASSMGPGTCGQLHRPPLVGRGAAPLDGAIRNCDREGQTPAGRRCGMRWQPWPPPLSEKQHACSRHPVPFRRGRIARPAA